VLREWDLERLADTAELVVSELVTNAVKASAELTQSRYLGRLVPGRPPVRLWVCADAGRALIQVWDASDGLPERPQLDLDAAGGRGLLLVETLAKEWGTAKPSRPSGKAVWAICTEP
jgi:two-component sensor histidine kinase